MTKFDKQLIAMVFIALILTSFGFGIGDGFLDKFAINFFSLLFFATVNNLNEFLTREDKPTLTIRVEKDSDILKN